MTPHDTLVRAAIIAVCAIGITGSAVAQKNQGGVTLTKNVDEEGRVPYVSFSEFSFDGGCNAQTDCANFVKAATDPEFAVPYIYLFDGAVVPAGKRLVIKWVTAALPANSPSYVALSLQSAQSAANRNLLWQYGGAWWHGPYYKQSMSSGAFLTYGPGERPHVRIFNSSPTGSLGTVTISGYLIDAVAN